MILAVCVSLVLAMTLHLWVIQATPDVVGGGVFLLFIWVGLPILFCSGAALVYCHKTRYDWRLMLHTGLLIVLIAGWLFLDGPVSIVISIVLDLLYIVSVVFFRFTLARQQLQ